MYERFSERARRVMQLANLEAQRFNHEYIGTEHILLALVKEGTCTAVGVFAHRDIDLRKIRVEVEKIVQSGPNRIPASQLPQTPRARKVIEYAIEEARALKQEYVGTGHLLLGLLREEESVAADVLRNLGLTADEVRAEIPKVRAAAAQGETPRQGPSSTAVTDELRNHPLVQQLMRVISELRARKEAYVAEQDFEGAAAFHGQEWKLQRSLHMIVDVLKANPSLGDATGGPGGP